MISGGAVLRIEAETDAGRLDRRPCHRAYSASGSGRSGPARPRCRCLSDRRSFQRPRRSRLRRCDSRWCTARRSPGFDGRGAQPAAFRQRVLHGRVLVVDHAGGRDRRTPAGSMMRSGVPSSHSGRRLRVDLERIIAFAARGAGLDPVDQRLLVLRRAGSCRR